MYYLKLCKNININYDHIAYQACTSVVRACKSVFRFVRND